MQEAPLTFVRPREPEERDEIPLVRSSYHAHKQAGAHEAALAR
ncbi:MAG: hypothetical protein AB7I25_02655 [Vicinamibacterales bacterium]